MPYKVLEIHSNIFERKTQHMNALSIVPKKNITPVKISPVEDIIADMADGKIVILVDEEDRENEGDLVLASDFVTSTAINFMARFGRGLI